MGQRGQSTLEWVIGAAVILGRIAVWMEARNERSLPHPLPSGVTANGPQMQAWRPEAEPGR